MKAKRAFRSLDGVLLLDKPGGTSSNNALQAARHLYQARKAGHTGALDPLATGLLPICFGEATKFSGFLLDADKRYAVSARLGARTDTADADGTVVETRPVPALEAAQVSAALAGLTGEIRQVPPMYSALKRDGQRLYRLAREGIAVERAPRPVTVHGFVLVGRPAADTLDLEVRCSKGTYVRTLVEDLAAALGTVGHVTRLRRLGVGGFDLQAASTFGALEQRLAEGGLPALDALLLPADAALASAPRIDLNADMAQFFRRGQAVFLASGPRSGLVRLYGPGDRFLGVGEAGEDGVIAPRRLVADAPTGPGTAPGADGSA